MKKVVYSLTKFRKYGNEVKKGIGYITNEDLIVSIYKDGKFEKRTYEDCIRYCHKLLRADGEQYKGNFTEYKFVDVPHRLGGYDTIEIEVEYELWFKIIND